MKTCLCCLLCLICGLLTAEDVLTVLAVSDTHAAYRWQYLAPLVRQERERAGKDVLLIDAGDTLAGDFPGSIRRGELPLRLLNFLKFDVWVPGNHDFEMPPYRFREFGGTVLGGTWRTRDFAPPSWRMFRRAGRNIAVIGLGESGLKRRFLPQDGITFRDAEQVLSDAVREALAAKADFFILVRHDGLYSASGSLYSLLQRHPEIGLVIGAHTHENIAGKKIGGTWVVQPGCYARSLAVIRIAFRDSSANPVITSSLQPPVPGSRPEFPAEIRELWQEVRETGSAVIGTVPGGLFSPADRDFRGPLGDRIEAALRRVTGAAAVICIGSRGNFSAPEQVTNQALFRLLPYETRIVAVRLTPAELEAVVRDMVKFQRKRRDLAIRFGGMKIYRDKRGLLQKAVLPPPGPDGKITVAMTHYELTGGGSRTSPLPGWIAGGMPYADTGRLLREEVARQIAVPRTAPRPDAAAKDFSEKKWQIR